MLPSVQGREIKQLLTSTPILAHYGPDLPIKMAGDASACGIGAIVSHVYSDSSEYPITFASQTLSPREQSTDWTRSYCIPGFGLTSRGRDINFAGSCLRRMFLVVVDAHSKWPEVVQMSTTTANNTIKALRCLFAAYGLPRQLI